jgi:hypothetical protein
VWSGRPIPFIFSFTGNRAGNGNIVAVSREYFKVKMLYVDQLFVCDGLSVPISISQSLRPCLSAVVVFAKEASSAGEETGIGI